MAELFETKASDGGKIGEESRLMRAASVASVSVALTLVAVKALVWFWTDSVSLLGSLVDSSLDLAASLISFYAILMALMPADADHRFGHGKAEALAGLFQAGLMGASAVFLLAQVGSRLMKPQRLEAEIWMIAVSVLAMVLTLALVLFQRFVIRHTRSLAIEGDHLHYQGDFLLNAGVILAAIGSGWGWIWLDSILGGLIGLWIAYNAWQVGRPSVDELMDREFDKTEREKLLEVILSAPGVWGVHDLRTRRSGRSAFIQMHLAVDGHISVSAGHLIALEVEASLSEIFPDAEILIHIDPPSTHVDQLTLAELGKERE